MAKFTLKGIKGVDKALKKLPDAVAKKVVRKAMRSAMKPVAARVKVLAPKKTGELSREVKVRAGKGRKGSIRIDVRLGNATADNAHSGDQFHGAFQEFGWKPGKRGKAKRTRIVAGKHFVEQAFHETAQQAKTTAETGIREGILDEAKKLGRGK